MALKDYLATEVALDHVEGHLSRRDALRRLGLLGLSAAGASALLAACGGSDSPTASPSSAAATTSAPATPAADAGYDVAAALARTEPIRFGALQGAFAAAAEPQGAVLVIHENKGLTDHIRSVAGRLAGDGYSALALDLLSSQGGTAAVEDPTAALGDVEEGSLVDDMTGGLAELARRTPGAKLGVMGFCFGGGMTWQLLDTGPKDVAAAVPFYGPVPDPASFAGGSAAVLGVFAEQDDRVNAGKDRAEAALTAAGLTHELRVVPGVDHAFFNDTGPRFNAAAAQTTYAAVLSWWGTHLA